MIKRIKDFWNYVHEDPTMFRIWGLNKLSSHYDDETYLRKKYRIRFKEELNLNNPQSFNEKLNWLKLYYHNPRLTILADKYAVKEVVKDMIGEEYVVPNYGVWESFEQIDFSKLPNQFVLKGTHDSGGAFVCRDKATFDYKGVGAILTRNLNRDFYLAGREWPYKNIPHRIIADKYLDDHTGRELRDYKFWCFNGVPKYMYLTIKGSNVFENFYDMDFNVADINHGFPRRTPEFEKPEKFDEMKKLAAVLSKGLPFVRVDFFQVEGKVYFGEFTFFDWGGGRPFVTKEMDLELGKLITLPEPIK